jgi:hypothetical protein
MTQDEIKRDLLQVCKVKGWDGDFNILAFHVLCDKLKQLGADDEREACAKLCDAEEETANEETWYQCAKELAKQIRARGNT